MGCFASQEFRGSESASHYVTIQYCGAWGYSAHAYEIFDRLEAKYPGKFRYDLTPDSGATGRLEVTLYCNSKAATETGGILVHSKASG